MSNTSAQLHALTKDKLVELVLKQDKDLAKVQKKLSDLSSAPRAIADGPKSNRPALSSKAPCPTLVAACIGGVIDPMSKTPLDDDNFTAEAPRFVNQAVTLAEMIEARLQAVYGSDESADEVDEETENDQDALGEFNEEESE